MSTSWPRRCASIAAQEFRRDLECDWAETRPSRLGGHDAHEIDTAACEDWPQQVMRSGEVQRFESGADDGVAQQFHRDAGLPGY